MEPEEPSINDTIKLRVAKPARNDISAWGPSNKMPNTSGVYFPYVPDLASSDTKTVPALINQYFLESLGRNAQTTIETHRAIIRAWGIIGLTDTGNVLAHMATVIRVALQAQGFVYPVFEGGVYEGCILGGGGFAIAIQKSTVLPVEYRDLQQIVQKAGSHSSALKSIAQIVDEDLGEDYEAVMESKSMRALATILVSTALSEEDRDNVLKIARRLTFPQRYWAVNSTTLVKVMDLIRDQTLPIDNDAPLHPSLLFSRDRVELVIGVFGYQAPSFMIPSCPEVRLAKGGALPRTFCVRVVDLGVAITDWKTMIRNKAIRNNPQTLSSRYQDRSFGGADKEVVFGALLNMAGVSDAPEQNTGGEEANVTTADVLDW